MASTIEIFCCYAHEDQPLLHKLKAHLMSLQWQGLISIWSDTNIDAGMEWEEEIKKHLDTAHIILLLVSSDFMKSDYCYSKEMRRAMERHEHGEAHVIPILLRLTMWKGSPFEKLQFLPTNAKAVTDRTWTEDEALYDVAEHISDVVKALRIQHSLAEGNRLYKEHHYEEALVIYEQLTHLESAYGPAHIGKGKALLALERYEESLAAFDNALQADSTVADARFYHSIAYALCQLQRYEGVYEIVVGKRAKKEYPHLDKKKPNDQRGDSHMETNEQIRRVLSKALEEELESFLEQVSQMREGELKHLEEQGVKSSQAMGRKLMEGVLNSRLHERRPVARREGRCGHVQRLVGERPKELITLVAPVSGCRARTINACMLARQKRSKTVPMEKRLLTRCGAWRSSARPLGCKDTSVI